MLACAAVDREGRRLSPNSETLQALLAASRRKDREAFLALRVDDDLEYFWSMKVIRNPFMQALELRAGKVAKTRDDCDGPVVTAADRKTHLGAPAQ